MKLKSLVKELQKGHAVILKCDTVWGIISLTEDSIYTLKKRARSKKIIKLVSSTHEIPQSSHPLEKLASKFWPGPLTLIHLNNAYRAPTNSLLQSLIKELGPVYASSANISGTLVLNDVVELKKAFPNLIVFDDQTHISGLGSTIYSLDTGELIREGEINLEDLINCLNS